MCVLQHSYCNFFFFFCKFLIWSFDESPILSTHASLCGLGDGFVFADCGSHWQFFFAFYEELDTLVNADLAKVAVQSAPPQDPIALRKTVLNHFPQADISYVSLESKPSLSATFFIEPKKDAQGKPITKLDNDQIYVNPYTGEILGGRTWGDITQGVKNLMPFIYRLHYSLALGDIGTLVFGIIALLWTTDCFVGTYLTFPAKPAKPKN